MINLKKEVDFVQCKCELINMQVFNIVSNYISVTDILILRIPFQDIIREKKNP